KGLYGLKNLFPNPFGVVNVGAMNDTPKNLKHRMSWPAISSSFTRKTHVDHRQDGSPMKNLTTTSRRKKKTTHLLILSVRFVKKDGREIFDMSIPNALLIDEIKGAPYYGEYQEHDAKCQQYLDAEHGKVEEGGATESPKATKVTKHEIAKATKPAGDKAPTLTSTQPPKPKPAPTQPSKAIPKKKQKLVKETINEPSLAKRSKGGLIGKIRKPRIPLKLVDEPSAKDVLVEEPTYNEEEANLQRALELSLKEQAERSQGPARPVVIREPDSERIQPLPDVQGKGKKKRRTPMLTEAFGHAESPSLDAELPLIDSETESDNIASGSILEIKIKARLNQTLMIMMKARLDQTIQMDEEFTTTAYPNVQENLKLPSKDSMIPEEPASSTRTLSSLQNLEKELSFIDQFFVEKKQEEEPGKTNAKAKVQSMVSVPIHQDTSSVPPMTTLVIDIMKSQSGSSLPTSTTTTSEVMTTTTIPPPPPQP
nr:hypothetical protein [Tanacetum cinerariifolium]